MPSATFAVISDLHCRLENSADDSFLTVGAPRVPSSRHPVESLLQLIHDEKLATDALLVPGDLTNRANREGLNQGWEYALEVGRKLNVPVIPVIGNHDIDSHGIYPPNPPLHIVRTLRPGFPFAEDKEVQRFFSDGYCLLDVGAAQLIAINTILDSTDKESAKRGTFAIDRIDKMERALQGQLTSSLRGALMHHHPILHAGPFLRDTDVIQTGDVLMAALNRLGCRFVIHGHKHFTRLTYVDHIAVLACGSFSAMLREFGTSIGNTFHVLSVNGDSPEEVRGTVKTWVFQYGSGWSRSNLRYKGFPFQSGFGHTTPVPTIIDALLSLARSDLEESRFTEPRVLTAAPDAEFLTPTEREDVNRNLSQQHLKLDDYDDGHLELWRSYAP